MRSFAHSFLIWLAIICGGGGAYSASAALITDFDSANQLYEERKFAEAAAAYEKIVTAGTVSPALYFNLGNAHYKAGQIGRAIAAYRQAQRLTPRDPDVQANLRFARNQVQGPTLRPTRWQTSLNRLSLNEWTGLAATGAGVTFLLLALMQMRPALKPSLRSATIALAGATVVLSLCLFSAYKNDAASDLAVVTKSETVAHNGPFDASPNAFTVQDGAELRVLDRKNDWLQVTDGGRHSGWLKSGLVITFAPRR